MGKPDYKQYPLALRRWYTAATYEPPSRGTVKPISRWRRAWWAVCRMGRRLAPWNYVHVDDIDYDD